MNPIVILSVLVAAVAANNGGWSAPVQQSAPSYGVSSYGVQQQDSGYAAPASAPQGGYGGQSAPSYAAPAAPSYAAPAAPSYAAPVEMVVVSYNSQQQDSGYAAPASAPQGGYGGQSSQSYAAPVETVQVAYNSQQQDSGYAAPASAPQGGYGGQSSQSYAAPVEAVRLAYNLQQQDSGYAAPASAPQGGYGGQSYAAPVETVRVSYNSQQQDSGYGAASGGYGGASAQSTYGGSSYGSLSTGNNVPIIRHNQEITAGVNHHFDYATGDGTSHSETTSVNNGEITKQGQYSYTAPDGQQISVSYTADANGFHPQGAHLPTSPPMPQEIAQSLRAQGYSGY